ncbi:MAG: glutathione synthase [Acidobacteriota bacterium]
MKIVFLVRRVDARDATYTTTPRACAAPRRGPPAGGARARDLPIDAAGRILCRARRARQSRPASPEAYLASLMGDLAEQSVVLLDAVDVLFLRGNPQVSAATADDRFGSWVLHASLALKDRGVLVVNDPSGLMRAGSKLYLMALPESARPRTLVSSDARVVKKFLKDLGGPAVLKPLEGFGGDSVFYVRKGEVANVNQYIAALKKDGPLVAQEYLSGARRGDKRLLLMDGAPLCAGGRPAVYRRTHPPDDMRNNMHAGGSRGRATLTSEDRAVIDAIGPRLREDGIYFAGVDLIDGKVIEVNVWSPGGIRNIDELYDADVASAVIADLEKKVLRPGRSVRAS